MTINDERKAATDALDRILAKMATASDEEKNALLRFVDVARSKLQSIQLAIHRNQ